VVLGLSKLARLTKLFAKRLQRQDRLGMEIGSTLHQQLQCQGVAVVLQALKGKASEQELQAIAKVCLSHPDLCDPSIRSAVHAMTWQTDPSSMPWSTFESASYA
jgi:hypothetical protein